MGVVKGSEKDDCLAALFCDYCVIVQHYHTVQANTVTISENVNRKWYQSRERIIAYQPKRKENNSQTEGVVK